MPLGSLRELQRGHLHHAIMLGSIGEMNAFVYRQTSNLSEVVVGMGSDGANTVRAEGCSFCITTIDLMKLC